MIIIKKYSSLKFRVVYLLLVVLAVRNFIYLVPDLWAGITNAGNSFSAFLLGVGIGVVGFMPLIASGFMMVLDYENYYKKTHTYNPHRRRWEKN